MVNCIALFQGVLEMEVVRRVNVTMGLIHLCQVSTHFEDFIPLIDPVVPVPVPNPVLDPHHMALLLHNCMILIHRAGTVILNILKIKGMVLIEESFIYCKKMDQFPYWVW